VPLAAVRRFVVLFGAVAAGTALVSLLVGVAVGHASRSVSLGLYLVGSGLLVGSFFFGNLGPLRSVFGDDRRPGFLAPRALRKATAEDRSQSMRSSALLFGIGFGLIVLGTFVDPAHKAI
jgi:type IV secretory pathway protease TraF